MANRQTFTLDIRANSKQAQKAISDLQRSIEHLSKVQVNNNYLDKGINDAVAAAKELEHHLSAALNQNTGKLNLNAFTQSLEESGQSARNLMQTLLQGGAAGQQTFTSLANAIAQSDVPLKRVNKTLQDFATTLKNTVKWEISSTIVHNLESALSGAVSYAKNLNASLTDIRIVTGQSVDDMARFAREANVAAKALSTTTKAYADASLIYYQQGDSAELAAKKAAITIKAANSSFNTTAAEMSEYLTSVWNSYQVGANELERYVDIMANLGAKTATSLEEIATSMQKVAATANTVGVSMEQVSSIIATVSSVTRESAESIGTSYKTIFARIGDLKLGAVDEDGVGLGQVSSQLDAIGVKILDESGNLRDMGDIITDLGNRWQTMNAAQKTAVAQVVAGKRQYTQLMALFENWDMYGQNMQLAENSEGALQEMQDVYAESWEAASARAQAAMESLYNLLLNDQAIISVVNGITSITDAVASLVKSFGGLGGVISHLGAIGSVVFKQQISGSIDNTVKSLKTFASQFKDSKTGKTKKAGEIASTLLRGNAKSVEQIEYENSVRQLQAQISNITGNNSNEKNIISNTQTLLELKTQLINSEHMLSDAQKGRAQEYLNQLSQEQTALVKIQQEQKKIERSLKNQESKAYKDLYNNAFSKDAIRQKTNNPKRKKSTKELLASAQNTMDANFRSYLPLMNSASEYYVEANNQTMSVESGVSVYSSAVRDIKVLEEALSHLKEEGVDVNDVIEFLRQNLSQGVSDKLKEDIEALGTNTKEAVKNLKQANKDLENIAHGVETSLVATAGEVSQQAQQQMSENLKNIAEEQAEYVNVVSEKRFRQKNIENIQQGFKALIDPEANKKVKSFGEGLNKAVGSAMAVASSIQSTEAAMSVLNDETASLGDKLGAVTGVAASLAEGFANGGLIGLGVAAIMAAITAYNEYREQQRLNALDKVNSVGKKSQEILDNRAKENEEIDNLLSNYNSLNLEYQKTGEGTDSLTNSINELAEAYRKAGYAVADFNGNLNASHSAIIAARKEQNQKSIDEAELTIAKLDRLRTSGATFDVKLNKNEYFKSSSKETVYNSFGGSYTVRDKDSDIISARGGYGKYSIADHYMQEALNIRFTEIDKEMGEFTEDYYKEMLTHLSDFDLAIEYLKTIKPQYKLGFRKAERLTDVNLQSVSLEDLKATYQYVAKQSGLSEKNQLLYDDLFSVEIGEENKISLFNDDLVLEWDNKKGSELLEQYRYIKQAQSENEDLLLDLDQQYKDAKTEIEKAEIQALISSAEWVNSQFQLVIDAAGETFEPILQLQEIAEFTETDNAILDNIMNQSQGINKDNIEELYSLIEQCMEKTNSELTGPALQQKISEILLNSAKIYDPENLDFTTIFDNLKTNSKKYGFDKEEQNAQLGEITQILMDAGIESVAEIDDIVWKAIKDSYNTDGVINKSELQKNVSAALTAQGKGYKGFKARGETVSKFIDEYEKGLGETEAQTLYDTIFSADAINQLQEDGMGDIFTKYGITSFEQFCTKSIAARTAFLQDIDSAYHIGLENKLEQSKNAALTQLADLGLSEINTLAEAEQKLEEVKGDSRYYIDAEGILRDYQHNTFKTEEEIATEQEKALELGYLQEGQTFESLISQNGQEITALTNLINVLRDLGIMKLMESSEYTFKDTINDVNTLTQSFEEFAKTGKISTAALKAFSQLGISTKTISSTDDYIEKLKEAKIAADNIIRSQIPDDFDPYKQWEDKDLGSAQWQEWQKNFEIWQQGQLLNEEIQKTILTDGELKISQMENRMQSLQEEANKTKTIADILSSAATTGILSNEQQATIIANGGQDILNSWLSVDTAMERANIAAQVYSQYTIQSSDAIRDMASFYENISKYNASDLFINYFKENGGLKTADLSTLVNFEDFLSVNNLLPEAISAYKTAYQEVLKKLGKTNFTDYKNSEILNMVQDELQRMGIEAENQANQALAITKNMILQQYQSLSEETQAQAQKAVDAWLNAFKDIANARKTILSGEDLLSDLADNPELIMRLANQMGKSAAEVVQMAIAGDIALENLKLPQFDREQFASSLGIREDFGDNQFKNRKIIADQLDAKPMSNEVSNVLKDYYIQLIKQMDSTLSDDQLKEAAKSLLNTGKTSILGNEYTYTALVNALIDAQEAAYKDAQNALQLRQEFKLASDIETAQSDKAIIGNKQVDYKEATELQSVIDRARETMAKEGAKWTDIDIEDRNLLAQYGITGVEGLDGAATQAANALVALAKAAEARALNTLGQDYVLGSDGQYRSKEGNILLQEKDPTLYAAFQSMNQQVADIEKTSSPSVLLERTLELEAQRADMEKTKFEEYIDYMAQINKMQDVNEIMEQNNATFEEAKEIQAKYAVQLRKMEKAYEKAIDEGTEHVKVLNDVNSTVAEQAESMETLRQVYEDVLGPMDDISDEFVKSADNMKLLQEAAKGDEEALNKLQVAYVDALNPDTDFTPELQRLAEQVAAWDPGDLEIGATIDDTEFLSKCNELINLAGLTAEQASNALSTMGVDATIVEHKSVVPPDSWDTVAMGTYADPATGQIIPIGASFTTTAEGREYSWYTLEGAKYNGRGITHGGGGSSHKPSGGGGGGGSSKKETKKLVRAQDEIERYHVQNEVLDRVADNLDEIEKLKERVYGKDYISAIDSETAALQEQLAAQKALHDEALKWMASDRADIMRYGAQFDSEGTITNYEQVMQRIIDEYNSAIIRYNNSEQGDGDKLALEDAQQRFEDAKESIENYEEAVSIANSSANDMLDIQNQLSELEVEKITYEYEMKLDMNERDLELFEYYQDKYENQLEHQDKVFQTFLSSLAEYESNLAALGKAYGDLNTKFALGFINEADYAEAMEELQSEIVDNLGSINEIQQELIDTYAETLSLAREEVEKTTDAIDHSNEAMQSFMNIMALSGLETDYKKIGAFYDVMNENNLTKIEIQRAHLNALLEEEERFKDRVEDMTDLEKQQYAALQEEIQDTRDTLLSSTEEALETIRSTYENTINDIAKNLDDFMAGAAGSMSYLQEQYGYFQEEQARYVSTAKELYEVSKLNRDIENTLGETTSETAKEALKALQEKINKQSELNELTEYDIEMNQLQYQLLLARIKLEEAQNAKDVVRLTRDESGNYAYRYTANQDKIDEAAQHYEDILQQINDTTVQRTSEIEQQLLNTMANYKDKFQEIATDYTLTEEERLMKLEELNNQFAESMRYLQEQNNIVTDNLTANQEAIANHYGVNMSQIVASTAGNVNDTIQSMIDKTEEYIAAMNNAIFGEEGAQTAWQKYLSSIGDIEGAAGTAYGDMIKDALEMGEANKYSAEQAMEVIQTLTDTLEPLANLSAAWNSHNAILEATISKYENLSVTISEALEIASEFANTTGVEGLGIYSMDNADIYNAYKGVVQETVKNTELSAETRESILESYQDAFTSLTAAFNSIGSDIFSAPTYHELFEQSVQITAEFPNVTNHTEVEEALENLINRAAQFASQKNL